MHLHDRAGTLASLLYKAEKPSVHLSVRPSVCIMLITQPCLHRLKQDLLEMKVVSLRITKFIFKSLHVQLFIHTSASHQTTKHLTQLVEHSTSKPKNVSSNPASAQCYIFFLPHNKTLSLRLFGFA